MWLMVASSKRHKGHSTNSLLSFRSHILVRKGERPHNLPHNCNSANFTLLFWISKSKSINADQFQDFITNYSSLPIWNLRFGCIAMSAVLSIPTAPSSSFCSAVAAATFVAKTAWRNRVRFCLYSCSLTPALISVTLDRGKKCPVCQQGVSKYYEFSKVRRICFLGSGRLKIFFF